MENTFEGRRDTAWFHTAATTTLVGMLLLWTAWQGQAPGEAANTGIANLILHLGAWMTGALAVDAAVDAWRLRREELAQFPGGLVGREPNTLMPLGSVAVVALIANTAMVLAALL